MDGAKESWSRNSLWWRLFTRQEIKSNQIKREEGFKNYLKLEIVKGIASTCVLSLWCIIVGDISHMWRHLQIGPRRCSRAHSMECGGLNLFPLKAMRYALVGCFVFFLLPNSPCAAKAKRRGGKTGKVVHRERERDWKCRWWLLFNYLHYNVVYTIDYTGWLLYKYNP